MFDTLTQTLLQLCPSGVLQLPWHFCQYQCILLRWKEALIEEVYCPRTCNNHYNTRTLARLEPRPLCLESTSSTIVTALAFHNQPCHNGIFGGMIEGGSVNRAPEIGFKISQESELLPVTLVSLKHTYGVREYKTRGRKKSKMNFQFPFFVIVMTIYMHKPSKTEY